MVRLYASGEFCDSLNTFFHGYIQCRCGIVKEHRWLRHFEAPIYMMIFIFEIVSL
ncbi:hypothetical protein SAMN06265218_101161 [Fodinibius sediminis]|uniref:Uncharacterized protein n=1 Tax=Fodinibius sediminis TaxID=1214077 RepID=A0A521AJB2_9BACT|nr:hypothetical protein SAMN06265218_101161 [Fodinibius sediminis]